MGKMVYLMGKSSSGKDTVYRRLLGNPSLALKRVAPFTTRPMRAGEVDGEQYFFTDEEGYRRLENAGRVVETRIYHTYHGLWRYFTVDGGDMDLRHNSYLMIGTLESFIQTAKYYGRGHMLPVLIEVEDGVRLKRALEREMRQENPRYQEMCRRFLADEEDFSEEKIKEAGISRRFVNEDLDHCLKEIEEYIRGSLIPEGEG